MGTPRCRGVGQRGNDARPAPKNVNARVASIGRRLSAICEMQSIVGSLHLFAPSPGGTRFAFLDARAP